jgi:uncharacterized protein (DUF1778 family)
MDKDEWFGFGISWIEEAICISEEDYNKFKEALKNPPEPNDKLKFAAERCKLGLKERL